MKKNKKFLIILLSIIFLSITIYICYKLIPLLISLQKAENQEKFKDYIQDMGWKGWLAFLVIQILQIFIAFIPGEIVEILAGILYGPIGGLFICLLGIVLGSLLIYYTVKMFANKYIPKLRDKLKTYSFLNNPKKIHIYLFIIFLIPGTPKDIFIYLIPFLPIKFIDYLIISSIARTPSILSSTIIGDSFVKGNYLTSIIVFSVFFILGLLGILFREKIIGLFKKNHKDELNNNDTLEN